MRGLWPFFFTGVLVDIMTFYKLKDIQLQWYVFIKLLMFTWDVLEVRVVERDRESERERERARKSDRERG